MAEPLPLPIAASRRLLQEVCALLAPFRDDAVLIGGWVPEIRFPDAHPAHLGSIDVDFAMRADRARHQAVSDLLLRHGFRRGQEPYQFIKDVPIGGRCYPVRLDLLTSPQNHTAHFTGNRDAPFPASGTEFAFQNSTPTVPTADSAAIEAA